MLRSMLAKRVFWGIGRWAINIKLLQRMRRLLQSLHGELTIVAQQFESCFVLQQRC